jgi:hypothetical protein
MLLVSFAYGYETLGYFAQGKCNLAMPCEETSETGESSEKNEKEVLTDDDFFHHKHLHDRMIFDQAEPDNGLSAKNNNFCSSDYSHEVYSPPEKA